MQVEFLSKFSKDLDKINQGSLKKEIVLIIEMLEATNKISEIKNLKKLKGNKFAYRIRTGEYRIGLFIENNIIELARIAHRKEIYRLFP